MRHIFKARKNMTFSTIKLSIQEIFESRNLYYQSTSHNLADVSLIQNSKKKSVYCGYDPTNDSLHLGNLVSIIMMGRLSLLGLKPIFLVGGATGLIGDPSGKIKERNLLEENTILNNIEALKKQISQVYDSILKQIKINHAEYQIPQQQLEISSQNNFKLINNYQFYNEMNVIRFLRDIGKNFRMGTLINKEIVANRLKSEDGISYAEFSYSIIQAYDFLKLYQNEQCILQFGGSDQWGNITNGCDLVRKITGKQVYGITMPLLLTKSGHKFGKSQGNALYLNAQKTSTDMIFNYFYNTADQDIQKYLRIFTFYSNVHISKIVKNHQKAKEKKTAQKLLAQSVIRLIRPSNIDVLSKRQFFTLSHNQILQKQQLFFEDLFYKMEKDNNQYYFVSKSQIQNMKTVADLLVNKGMVASKGEVRRQIDKGGLYINNTKFDMVDGSNTTLTNFLSKYILFDKYILVRWGKKRYQFIKFEKQ